MTKFHRNLTSRISDSDQKRKKLQKWPFEIIEKTEMNVIQKNRFYTKMTVIWNQNGLFYSNLSKGHFDIEKSRSKKFLTQMTDIKNPVNLIIIQNQPVFTNFRVGVRPISGKEEISQYWTKFRSWHRPISPKLILSCIPEVGKFLDEYSRIYYL